MWVAEVSVDNIALAAAMVFGLAVMAFNTWVLELTAWLVILFRTVVVFVTTYIAVFLLLHFFRRFTLSEVKHDLFEEKIHREASESLEEEPHEEEHEEEIV